MSSRQSSLVQPVSLRTASAFGALVSVVLTILVYQRFTAFTLLGIGLTLGFLLYAFLGEQDDPSIVRRRAQAITLDDSRAPGVLTVVFLLANAGAVLTLSTAYYSKPLAFYICIGLAAGVLAVRVVFTNAHPTNGILAVVYGLNTFVSNQLAFPLGLSGPDIGDHVGLAINIVQTAHVMGGGTYNGFPAHHLLVGKISLLAGGTVPPTYRTIGIVGMLLGLPLTYLVARKLGDRRFAVLSMVIYASMEYVVYRAGHPSKLAFALPLLLLMFATVVTLYEMRTPGMIALFALFATALIFTHPHTAFVSLVMLVALAVGQVVVPRFRKTIGNHSEITEVDGGPSPARVSVNLPDGRGHALALLFSIAFIAQFLYFARFFGTFVSIASQYVDILLLEGGPDTVKQTPRFSTIPTAALLVNTIGSGILVGLITLGVLDQVKRRVTFSMLLVIWLAVAGVLMVGGVILNVPFALPNRVYVMTEITGFGLLAAAGVIYLVRRARWSPNPRLAVILVAGLFFAFAFFSTASTIAGIETSPFNEEVPHQTWYGMSEENAAEGYLVGGEVDVSFDSNEFRWARSFPVTDAGTIEYNGAERGAIIGLNEHKIRTGIPVGGGQGRIGTGAYVIPNAPRKGLTDNSRLYDNGGIEAYRNDS